MLWSSFWDPTIRLLKLFIFFSLGGAPTWNTAGLVGIFKPTLAQVRLCQTSMDLFRELEAQGLPNGWNQCGSLCLARSNDRMTVFRRMKALSVYVWFSIHLLWHRYLLGYCSVNIFNHYKYYIPFWFPGERKMCTTNLHRHLGVNAAFDEM